MKIQISRCMIVNALIVVLVSAALASLHDVPPPPDPNAESTSNMKVLRAAQRPAPISTQLHLAATD